MGSSSTSIASNEASATPAAGVLANVTCKIVGQLSGLALDDPNSGGSGTGADQKAYNFLHKAARLGWLESFVKTGYAVNIESVTKTICSASG